MALTKLHCPNCAAALDLPDNLTVAHCMYCGTKILIDPEHGLRDQKAIRNFVELCDALLDAKNYVEAIEFANKALERDPKNADAWTVKARATFWLSSPENDRFDEAMNYLSKAMSLAPNSDSVVAARGELVSARAEIYKRQGEEKFRLAQEKYKIQANGRMAVPIAEMRAASHELLVAAMRNFSDAVDLQPDDMEALEGMEKVAKFGTWIKFSDQVKKKLARLDSLRLKRAADQKVAYLTRMIESATTDLTKKEKELEALKLQSGFVAGLKTIATENSVSSLKLGIANAERELQRTQQYIQSLPLK